MALMDQMMAELAKKSGLDLNKIDKPRMNGNDLELKITEAQLKDIIASKNEAMKGNIEVMMLLGEVVIKIKIA